MGTIPITQQRLFQLTSTPYGLDVVCLAPSCSWRALFSDPMTLEELTAACGQHLKDKGL